MAKSSDPFVRPSQAALQIYDGPIHATMRSASMSICNAAALLWRLDILGCEIGDRWPHLAARWEGHADGKLYVFPDIHAAMSELRAGYIEAFDRRRRAMRKTAADGNPQRRECSGILLKQVAPQPQPRRRGRQIKWVQPHMGLDDLNSSLRFSGQHQGRSITPISIMVQCDIPLKLSDGRFMLVLPIQCHA
jgi:hypothetical protein